MDWHQPVCPAEDAVHRCGDSREYGGQLDNGDRWLHRPYGPISRYGPLLSMRIQEPASRRLTAAVVLAGVAMLVLVWVVLT